MVRIQDEKVRIRGLQEEVGFEGEKLSRACSTCGASTSSAKGDEGLPERESMMALGRVYFPSALLSILAIPVYTICVAARPIFPLPV